MSDTALEGDEPQAAELPYRWLGGHLALDFTNTVAWEHIEGQAVEVPHYERLTGYDRLVRWALEAGELDLPQAEWLQREALRRPAAARRALQVAAALRADIHRLMTSEGSDTEALDRFNAALSTALSHLRLAPSGGALNWSWDDPEDLDRPLWPVLRAAAELLASGPLERVRECAGEPCGFLFLDTSRPGRRRWCTMADCGNRAKARRHYRRIRAVS